MRNKFYRLHGKRIVDLLIIIPGFLLLSPLYLIVILLTLISEGSPVFYIQSRVGKDFKEFKLFKFRTMINKTEDNKGFLTIKNDKRITPTGQFLRKYKFDELPQLLNIILGEMSIVGPRPEVPHYVTMFKKDYKSILQVRPGLADYATLEFHDEEEMLSEFDNHQEAYVNKILPAKINLYNQYINDQSLWTDLKIIFKTVWKILG